jgi:hypothetical protein
MKLVSALFDNPSLHARSNFNWLSYSIFEFMRKNHGFCCIKEFTNQSRDSRWSIAGSLCESKTTLREGIGKGFNAPAGHTLCLNRRRAENMDWDFTFFIPGNNPFRKQWFITDHDETTMLTVTEVNRCMTCVACHRQIGEVATMFYEIDEKYYCSKCGFEVTSAKRMGGTGQKMIVSPQASL